MQSVDEEGQRKMSEIKHFTIRQNAHARLNKTVVPYSGLYYGSNTGTQTGAYQLSGDGSNGSAHAPG